MKSARAKVAKIGGGELLVHGRDHLVVGTGKRGGKAKQDFVLK